VLDAPIDDMLAGARRMLGFARAGDRRAWFRVDEPWASLVLRSLEIWSDVDLASIVPADVLATLPHDLPVLVVGAGADDRAPPDTVERLFARLPMHAGRKRLWLAPGGSHGRVFVEQPREYAERLDWLLANLRR
jgi:pimeloyl-ACP methyl ester carboxylesterase